MSSYPEEQDAQLYALDVAAHDLDTLDVKSGKTGSGTIADDPLSLRKGVYLLETAQVSNRMTSQREIFTLHGEPTSPLPIPAADTFQIPAGLRTDFQSRLMDLGIDASHIYPDIDGLCKSLDWKLKSNKPFSAIA